MFDNDTVLIGGAEIARRVEELGAEISAWVASRGVSLVVVWLAEGAVYFAADLTRKIACKSMRIHSLKVSSYGDRAHAASRAEGCRRASRRRGSGRASD